MTSPQPLRRIGPAAVLVVAGLVGGCVDQLPEEPDLGCTVLVAPPGAPDPVTGSDTLDVVVTLPSRTAPVELLVRVDSFDGEGMMTFPDDVPPTAAGVGVALTTRATFTVCVSPAPRAIVFQGDGAPHDKAWIRASTDRPVKAIVRIGGGRGVTLEPPLVVESGASARHRWTIPEAAR